MLPPIQHAGLYLSGFFEYEKQKLQEPAFNEVFAHNDYFERSKEYFEQKYFPNWLQTLYPQGPKAMNAIGLGTLQSNHLVKQNICSVPRSITVKGKMLQFVISKVELHIFRENLGLFTIAIQTGEDITFETVADLVYGLRNTTDNQKYTNTNPLFAFIESDIIPFVHTSTAGWRKLNPQLKAFLNIDTKTSFKTGKEWNDILTDLATASPLYTIGHKTIHDFHGTYYQKLLANNVLNVFHNWRTMILFDNVVRISINLKEEDRNNMWENEYITIYIFILYIQLYLFRMHKELGKVSSNSSKAASLRDEFIHFRHDFDLSQISYKFLPNEIFKKLIQVLEITQEINRIDEKINRIDTSIREKKESKIERLLLFLTTITSLSVIWDSSSLLVAVLGYKEDSPGYPNLLLKIASSLLVVFGLIGISVYRRWKK